MFLFCMNKIKIDNIEKSIIVMLIIDNEQLSKRNKTYTFDLLSCVEIPPIKTVYSTPCHFSPVTTIHNNNYACH